MFHVSWPVGQNSSEARVPSVPVSGHELGHLLEGIMDTGKLLVEVRAAQALLVYVRVPCFVALSEFDEHTSKYLGAELGDGVNALSSLSLLKL